MFTGTAHDILANILSEKRQFARILTTASTCHYWDKLFILLFITCIKKKKFQCGVEKKVKKYI